MMRRTMTFVLVATVSMFFTTAPWTRVAAAAGEQKGGEPTATGASKALLRLRDYSFAYWPNGFRKEKGDASRDLFCIESGRYGLVLDLANLSEARLGTLDGPGYGAAVATGGRPMGKLLPEPLKIEMEHQGKVYRAVNCLAGRAKDPRHVILLESGRFAQRYRLAGLEFRDAGGKVLETASSLDLVAWPPSMTFTVSIAPDMAYEQGPCPGVVGAGQAIRGKAIDVPHRTEMDSLVFTLEAWVNVPQKLARLNRAHWLVGKNSNESHQGNFGFRCNRDSVTATMNIGRGRQNIYKVEKRKALTPGGWHHLAMSYDSRFLRLFVDGRSAGATKVGKVRVPGKGSLRIGNRPDGRGKAIHALFDELRIWNRALAPQEIRAHTKTPSQVNPKGLGWQMSFNGDAAAGEPAAPPNLKGATVRMSLSKWSASKQIAGDWPMGEARDVVLHCPVANEPWIKAPPTIAASSRKGMKYDVRRQPKMGAYVIDVPRFDRDWRAGYTDIRAYDEVEVKADNKSGFWQYVPVLFDVKRPANITGQVPILCDAEGKPTGIPVQLSKNWHHGAYSKFYTMLPFAPGRSHYRLRIAYGFWGEFPSASHAQLSLWGYGGNGRWDQLAIGCWGETMCFDMDNSLTGMMVTDVRMLMVRNGRNGRRWSWTDGGWGGDWIGVNRTAGSKLMPTELKTAYLAHGPCLTDVRHGGYYGKNRDIAFGARIGTLRTDDYNRVFQQFSYRFRKQLSTEGAYVFKMGPTGSLLTPRIAYGNRNGLIAEHAVPGTVKAGSVFKEQVTLTGPGPWWIAFPGSFFANNRDWGTGSRALIVRSFKVVHRGRECRNLVVSFPVHKVDGTRRLAGLNMELVVPKGVTHFMPGDTIDMDVEWITVPRIADDYYGPNEAFRSHLEQNPKSWKTVHREALGNDLKVSVTGGTLLRNYPIVVAATQPEVQVTIRGGVGVVPIRFEGLPSATGHRLYRLQDGARKALTQSVYGNDCWQTDYDAKSRSFKMTFNLPLDGVKQSTWVLVR